MNRSTAIILCVLIPVLLFSQGGSKNFIDQNYIEVFGQSKMDIIPNIIHLSITLNEKENDKSIEEQEQSLIKVLNELGIDTKKDISVSDFLSNIESHWLTRDDIVKTKEYQVIIHDPSLVHCLYLELGKKNISNISVTKTTHSDIEHFKKETKRIAIENGKNKAFLLLNMLDQKPGKAIYVLEMAGKTKPIRDRKENFEFGKLKEMELMGYPLEFQKIFLEEKFLLRFTIE